MDLNTLCREKMQSRGVSQDKRYEKRLRWELEEIQAKEKSSYFTNLVENKIRYPQNQNNLLVCWLLGIAPDFNIEKLPNCTYGEFPDIDTDYLPIVREYLKTVWAAKEFGKEYVCNIGNYTTFGIKSALIDMARVHSESREEVQGITKNLEAKDDEGKALTWDAAMKLYPELKKYCEEHKDVADAAKKLLFRNRGMGVHAGGLIIANSPLHDLVPLVKRKDAPQASAWVEGLHGQDLGPMGLVKFDLLVISNLLQIARCCELVKKRHNLKGLYALPGQPDWSDVPSWRNDKQALATASRGDLKGIFQFDKETVRAMARMGGVDRFEDLVAYTSLNRPGPLGMKMQERYIQRKRGREHFTLHPLVQPILEKTYGVLTYQEQIMRILNVVGEIPLKDCELVRKAISKKKVEGFIEYKAMFLKNGQKNLGVSETEIAHLWSQIESFAEYGFNLSHAVAYTYISQMLLCLKTHYPHEFYASILGCESLTEKIKEYKMEAKISGIQVNRVDINHSGINFELKDSVIYYGLSNIKGIGEEPAKRIVANQPYRSFEDFLLKFGTDASVLKPLLGLRCFNDRDPITLWKFAEHFKECIKKIEDRKKRYVTSLARYEDQFKKLLPEDTRKLSDFNQKSNPFDTVEFQKYNIDEIYEVEREVELDEEELGECESPVKERIKISTIYEDEGICIDHESICYFTKVKSQRTWNLWKALKSLWQQRQKTIDRHVKVEEGKLPRLAEFDASEWGIKDDLGKILSNKVGSEEQYYGFAWIHELELSPDYRGNLTFDVIKTNDSVGPVELKITKATQITSKKGTVYHQITAEDVTGQVNKINVWQDDWQRFSQEFEIGNLLRVRLQPPSGGFNSFGIESNYTDKWRKNKKYNDKSDDARVFIMQKGKAEEEKFLSDEEALASFDSCIMENDD